MTKDCRSARLSQVITVFMSASALLHCTRFVTSDSDRHSIDQSTDYTRSLIVATPQASFSEQAPTTTTT